MEDVSTSFTSPLSRSRALFSMQTEKYVACSHGRAPSKRWSREQKTLRGTRFSANRGVKATGGTAKRSGFYGVAVRMRFEVLRGPVSPVERQVSLRKMPDRRTARNVLWLKRASAGASPLSLVARIKSSGIPPRGPRERTIETFSSGDSCGAYKGSPCYRAPCSVISLDPGKKRRPFNEP